MSTDTPTLPAIEPLPQFAGILRESESYASGTDDRVSGRLNGSFDKLMLHAGLEISPSMVLLLCLCSGIALGGLIFVVQENLLTTAIGSAFGFVLPVLWAMIARGRRQTLLMKQMPPMVDELARAAKTGRSLDQCLEVVAGDTPAPLGDELQRCVRRMQLGLSISESIRELPERTGLVSLSVFVMALSVHQQTGGDLMAVLNRLSTTIRDRISFLGRLRAATAASRASAIMMICIPPAIMAFFVFRDPEYLTRLMESTWGRNLTIFALFLQVVGSFWVLRILKDSQRT